MAFDWHLGNRTTDTEIPPAGSSRTNPAVASHVELVSSAPFPSIEPEQSSPLPSRRQLREENESERRSIPRRPAEKAKANSRRGSSPQSQMRANRPSRKGGRSALPKLLSIGAMCGAIALVVATSVPANAFMTPTSSVATPIARTQAQTLDVVNASAVVQTSSRDKYTVTSLQSQMRLLTMSSSFVYSNDPNGTIQWPFPVEVPISTGWGPRQVAGCSFCSTFHQGVDFNPGVGVAIGSIADGIVSSVVLSHAGLGNHVVVDHVINGQAVQSTYAHMLDGSIRVAVGDHVTVTQELGQVGSTGESTGPHLHLGIALNGVLVDPFAWLKANAN